MTRTLLHVSAGVTIAAALLLYSCMTAGAAMAQAGAAPTAAVTKKPSGPVILKFKVPKPGVFTPAGQPIIVTGASMEPNATALNCVVGLQTNSHGYGPTQGTGPAGRQYVNWSGQTEPLKPGLNMIEAELICLHPGSGNQIIKHVNHNVTATVLPATSSALPTVVPPPAKKAPTTTTTPAPASGLKFAKPSAPPSSSGATVPGLK